jgi:hypothetical protein
LIAALHTPTTKQGMLASLFATHHTLKKIKQTKYACHEQLVYDLLNPMFLIAAGKILNLKPPSAFVYIMHCISDIIKLRKFK